MSRAAHQITRWIDGVEGLTLVQVGRPTRRWSWFQIAWAVLHGGALVMHLFSVAYHVRRAVCTKETEPLIVAGCPAAHVRVPLSIAARRADGNHPEPHIAVS
jgi:hypothetical protein